MSYSRALPAVCFAAGLAGALVNSVAIWLAGRLGLAALLGVKLAPALTPDWLYPRLVWGGLWGLAYYLTIGSRRTRRHWVRKGLWVSLLPTLCQLLYFFPRQPGIGLFGYGLGHLTPVFVLFFNALWGFATGVFTRLLWGRE